MLGYICIIFLFNACSWMKYFCNFIVFYCFINQFPCWHQVSGTVQSVSLCATASTNHRRTWRAKSSCLSSRARSTSWDESHPSLSTTRSWSGEPNQHACVNKSAWARCDMTSAPGCCGCASAMPRFLQIPSGLLSMPEFSLTSSTHWTGSFSQRHQRCVRLSSWRADRNPSPPPAAPPWPLKCGNSGFVQDADPWCPLGRLSTDQSKNPSICHHVSTSVTHTLQLYPWVTELMAEKGFSWAFRRKVHKHHASYTGQDQ